MVNGLCNVPRHLLNGYANLMLRLTNSWCLRRFNSPLVVNQRQPIEQGQYIGLALAGVFETQGWRNHGGVDPTEQWFWWSSATASPINPEAGELALNFGRFQDPEIDAALQSKVWLAPRTTSVSCTGGVTACPRTT